MRLQVLSDLVGSIYDTVVDPSACPTMLNQLADLVGASSGAQIGTYNSRTHIASMLAPRLSAEELHSFSEYWAKAWRPRSEHPPGTLIILTMLISKNDRCQSAPSNRWPNSPDPEIIMGATLAIAGNVSTVLLVSRPFTEGQFNSGQIRLFSALIPHLQRALQLRFRLAALDGDAADLDQAAVVRSEWLSRDFGLTRAEAVFAVEILKGDGLLATARRLGVALTTVRTHLAHVFDKTGTRRQAELVRLILEGRPATRGD